MRHALSLLFLLPLAAFDTLAAPKADYAAAAAIFTKHCLDCHAQQDPEGGLVLESFAALMKGGENGAIIVPGKSSESLMVKFLDGTSGRKGKNQFMPPGNRKHLAADEIAIIRAWIDAGAPAPTAGQEIGRLANLPKIAPRGTPRSPINALAYAPKPNLVAVARHGVVELRDGITHALLRTLTGLHGQVNALAFTTDGAHLFAAAGEAGLAGEIRQFKTADATLVRVFDGHRDAIYSLALSPDNSTLASGSYDQKIILWNAATAGQIKTLNGHNGAVFALDFRPDGKLLASASADRTVKLWDVASGERRDTLAQSLKELYTIAFSPDGKRLLAGGVDNRIRVWAISEKAAETTNPLLESRFAHEGAILKLAFSRDGRHLLSAANDRTVKLWDAGDLKEKHLLTGQPDWSPAVTFLKDESHFAIGRLDGSLEFHDLNPPRKNN